MRQSHHAPFRIHMMSRNMPVKSMAGAEAPRRLPPAGAECEVKFPEGIRDGGCLHETYPPYAQEHPEPPHAACACHDGLL